MSAYPAHRPPRHARTLADGDTATSLAFRLIAGHAMPALGRFEAALPDLLPEWRQWAGIDACAAARAARIVTLIGELAGQQRAHIAGHSALSALARRHALAGPAEPLATLGHEPLADAPESEVTVLVPLMLNPCYRVGLLMAAPDAWQWLQGEVATGRLPDAFEPWRRLRDLYCHLLGCDIAEAEHSFVDLALRLLGESALDAPSCEPSASDDQ